MGFKRRKRTMTGWISPHETLDETLDVVDDGEIYGVLYDRDELTDIDNPVKRRVTIEYTVENL